MARDLIKSLQTIAAGVLVMAVFSACANFPLKPKPLVGKVVMPFDYTPVPCADATGQIRVAFAAGSPGCHTLWRLADSDRPGPWRRVQPAGKCMTFSEPAGVYLLQFSATHDIPPENRTVTILEKQRLNLEVRYHRK